ncbi:SRPBCC family protein [Pseudoroseicyclus sp. H15]
MTAHAPADDKAARTLTLIRVMQAPAAKIYRAFTAPEHMKAWFGPGDYPVTTCEMDFREGGNWMMRMTGPDGKEGPPFGGHYIEIVPDEKVVFETKQPNDEWMRTTATFTELGEGTTVTVSTEFSSLELRQEQEKFGYAIGLGLGLDQLATYAAGLP